MSEDCEVLSVGCNEVPKPGGGTYWSESEYDFRDFRIGYDSSVKFKKNILFDIFRRLKSKNWLNDDLIKKDIEQLYSHASETGFLDDAHVMDILEHGRIIHAEMCAITDAARMGRALKGATLYCTTFPCHICARHIVATGIKRVVYIEPYPKSLASELYPDSISIEGQSQLDGPKVHFESFVGIAPERYQEIFSKGRRKDSEGRALTWTPLKAEPILKRLVPAYITIEKGVLDSLSTRLTERGLNLKPSK